MVYHYRINPGAVMQMACRVFWMLWTNIDRLLAEQEIRSLTVTLASKSPDGATRMIDALKEVVGTPVVAEQSVSTEPLDVEGLDALRKIR